MKGIGVDIYRTEQEQIEAIKKFFHKNGTSLLIGFVVLVVGFFGYQTWVSKQQASAAEASRYYNELRSLAEPGAEMTAANKAKFDEIFAQLLGEHSTSIYASYASLLKAKRDVENNDLDKAEKTLQWVVDSAVNQDLVALATLRLARVVFAQGGNDKALKLLEADGAPFASAYEELRGDIYVEMNQADKALEAYTKSKELKSGKESFNDRILEMKIESLAAMDAEKLTNVGAVTDAAVAPEEKAK